MKTFQRYEATLTPLPPFALRALLVAALAACSGERPINSGQLITMARPCSDRRIDAVETCDDGNVTEGDGCTAACTVEEGWTCGGEPSVCVRRCGNGRADPGELCDDPSGNSDAWAIGRHCNASCSGLGPYCGDNKLLAQMEGCDDGNRVAWDGCSHQCQIEPGWVCEGEPSVCTSLCGNGVRDPGETCDDAELNSDLWSPQRHCNVDCSGTGAYCGDGLIDGDEECDDDRMNSDTEADACRSWCKKAACGDAVTDAGEQCDDGGRSARCTETCSAAKSAHLAAGDKHTCVILETGALKCWGSNGSGQLGAGELPLPAYRFEPLDVVGLDSGVVMVAAGGSHTCAVVDTGALKCWGSNSSGQLGIVDDQESFKVPVDADALGAMVASVTAGGDHSCALLESGAVKCWGSNSSGQVGSGDQGGDERSPVAVPGLGAVRQLVAGGAHTCALLQSGAVKCWGSNHFGAIGDGRQKDSRASPSGVSGLERGVLAIASGWEHTCALLEGGQLMCWGLNLDGQLGNGKSGWQEQQDTPVPVHNLGAEVEAVAAGGAQTCALLNTGVVKCWGLLVSESGDYARTPDPMTVSGLGFTVSSLASGGDHTCALHSSGRVFCWGENAEGQLGSGDAQSNAPQPVPVEVIGLPRRPGSHGE